MTWQMTLVAVWIQFALGAAAILGLTSLALRWIAQPAERARLIQLMLAAVLVLPLLSALAPFPAWNLGLISRGPIEMVPDEDPFHDLAEIAAAARQPDSPAEVELIGELVVPRRDAAIQSEARDNLLASRAEPPASVLSPLSVIVSSFPSIDAWMALAVVIVLAHVAAVIYLLAQRAIGNARLRRLCCAASEATEPVQRVWEGIAGSRAPSVRLLVSTEIEAPLMFGWRRPVVVIPHEIASKCDAALACCLAHEWSHIERADMLSWRFVNFCQFALWYQPAFWTLRRELRICQEFLADYRSVGGAAGSVEYSELLLSLANRRRALGVAGALTMFDQPSQLARRIRMLLEHRVPLRVRCRRPFTCCVLAVSAMLATTISAVRVDAIQADAETVKPAAVAVPQAAEPNADEKPVAHMISYTELMMWQGHKEPIRQRVFIADDGRKRMEQFGPSGTITTVFDANGFLRVSLMDFTKTAMVYPRLSPLTHVRFPPLMDFTKTGMVYSPKEHFGGRVTRSFMEDLGRHPIPAFMEWFQNLRKTSDKPVKELGQKDLDGKRVNGIIATHADKTHTIWTDSTTGAPVRIENDSPINGLTTKLMTDFRFGAKLDESLFSFDVPEGYKLWQAPAVASAPAAKEGPAPAPAADLEPAWSREGQWVAVAAIEGQSAIYGVYRLQSVIKLNERGEDLATTKIISAAFKIRAAKLSGNRESDFLAMFNSSPVTAYSADEKVLWYYSQEGGPGDVCATDLNDDGFDELILSYTGFGGLQALDHAGKLLWKNTSLGNVWTVSAGNLEGNARPEIVAADGKVHIFDGAGKHLRSFDPGFSTQVVRIWDSADKDGSTAVITAAGTDAANKTKVAGLNPDGTRQWSFDLSARIFNAATCRQRPWLALALADGGVRVIDVVAGKEIAKVDNQGNSADVAWLPTTDGAPLLVVATREELHAYRVPSARP